MKLTHVRLLVSDYPACLKFYRDVIGLPAHEGGPNLPYAELPAGDVFLAIADRKLMASVVEIAQPANAATAPERVALCLAVDDVDLEFARIKAAGAPVVSEPADRKDWGIRTAHFRDPDGNIVEINKRIG
jgi:lactoylglutathione lyase